jgi:hypothetical protein
MDADGWTSCVICGREPSIRLSAGVGANGSNGVVAGDLTPELVRESRNGGLVAPPVQLALF